MSDNQRRTNPFDPTDERTADPAMPDTSGLGVGQGDVVNSERPELPPRRYETDEEFDPASPNTDPTLNTKI